MSGLALALIDDAAMFPPGNAPLAEAVAASYARRDTAQATAVGPLLVPASAVEDLRSHADPTKTLDVALIGDTGIEGLSAARDALQNDTWVELHQVEVRVTVDGSPEEAVRALLDQLSFTVTTYLELPLDDSVTKTLTVLAEDGAERAKFRTGPFIVPTAEALANGICTAVAAGVRFKLTGGLHHALPTHDLESGQQHHGFLNTLAATSLAVAGASVNEVAAALREADVEHLLSALTASEPSRIRHFYCSFGSCSIAEPFDELVRLELADRP
ncbi:MAG: hypothetical protein ABI720_05965 [Actinomycetes bacterium]